MPFPVGPTSRNPFNAARGPSSEETEVDDVRGSCFIVSIAYVVIALVHMATFWAAYFWAIVLIVLTLTTGFIGLLHFRSMDQLETNSCCCDPLGTVRHFSSLSIAIIVGGALSCLVSLAAAVLIDDSTFRALAIVSLVTSVGYVVAGFFGLRFGQRLLTACQTLETMQPPQWAQPSATTARQEVVVGVVQNPNGAPVQPPQGPHGYPPAQQQHPHGGYPPPQHHGGYQQQGYPPQQGGYGQAGAPAGYHSPRR